MLSRLPYSVRVGVRVGVGEEGLMLGLGLGRCRGFTSGLRRAIDEERGMGFTDSFPSRVERGHSRLRKLPTAEASTLSSLLQALRMTS